MKKRLIKTTNKDLPVLAKIYSTEFSKKPYNEKWTEKKSINKMKFLIRFYDLYTIKVDDEIIGFACVNPTFMCPGEVAFGEEMAIREDFQGKGIGTFVIKEIFKIYKKRGFKRYLGIVNIESSAGKLYKRLKTFPSKTDVLIEKRLN